MKIYSHARYRVLCEYIAGETSWLPTSQIVEVERVLLVGPVPGRNAHACVRLTNGLAVPLDVFQAICEIIPD
jgi:hypothetical protein